MSTYYGLSFNLDGAGVTFKFKIGTSDKYLFLVLFFIAVSLLHPTADFGFAITIAFFNICFLSGSVILNS